MELRPMMMSTPACQSPKKSKVITVGVSRAVIVTVDGLIVSADIVYEGICWYHRRQSPMTTSRRTS